MATNNTLIKFIDNFNEGYENFAAIKPLSEDVEFVEFIDKEELLVDNFDKDLMWYQGFMLKVEGVYVGIVQDGGSDLHIYIKEEFRKKTNLIKNLNNLIIPFILKSKDKQYLTFVNEKVEKYFLNNLTGITSIGNLEAVIEKNKIPSFKFKEFSDEYKNRKIDYLKNNVKTLRSKLKILVDNANNKKAVNYLISQSYISQREFEILRPDEKVGYSFEKFKEDRAILNPLIKEKELYCKMTKVYLGEDVEKKLRNHLRGF